MTDADLRKHFDLKPCPNPSHSFSIGSLIGKWIWAEDCWSQLAQGRLQTFYFTLHRIDSATGTRAYSLVLWKLKIIWGWV